MNELVHRKPRISTQVLPIVLASLVALLSQPAFGSEYEERELFRDEEAAFELTYPKTWETNPLTKGKRFAIRNSDSTKLGVISVSVARLKNDLANPKFYLDHAKNKLPQELVEATQSRVGNAELVSTEETVLSGQEAVVVTLMYDVNQPTGSITIVSAQLHCVKDGKLYLLNFESPAFSFDENWTTFEKVMTTFTFRS